MGYSNDIYYPESQDYFNRAVNNGTATLIEYVDVSETDIDVSSGAGTFPDSGLISVDSELIYYTYKTSLIPTGWRLHDCVRGWGSTTAAIHSNGTVVERRVVAQDVNHVQEAVEYLEKNVGFYEEFAMISGQLVPANVGTIFYLHKGELVDPLAPPESQQIMSTRSMFVDYQIEIVFTDTTPSIYEIGKLACVRYTSNADGTQKGDVDVISSFVIDSDGASTTSGIDFSMSGSGADSTVLQYTSPTLAHLDYIKFRGLAKFNGTDDPIV